MTTTAELLAKKCRHTETALKDEEITEHLGAVDGWMQQGGQIMKTFRFANYYETLAFVNAAAYLFHLEDHHPELVVTYNRCSVKFHTHSVNGGNGGLSENDFICAAKVDAIYHQAGR